MLKNVSNNKSYNFNSIFEVYLLLLVLCPKCFSSSCPNCILSRNSYNYIIKTNKLSQYDINFPFLLSITHLKKNLLTPALLFLKSLPPTCQHRLFRLYPQLFSSFYSNFYLWLCSFLRAGFSFNIPEFQIYFSNN